MYVSSFPNLTTRIEGCIVFSFGPLNQACLISETISPSHRNLTFPAMNDKVIDLSDHEGDEEDQVDYCRGGFHAVEIGDKFNDR